MKYMGSKARFSKEILPIILKERTADQWYIEPFAGNGKRLGFCGVYAQGIFHAIEPNHCYL